RYDLNNFFFVNNDSKSYNAAATKTDIVQNKCIGKLDNNGTWICFCGDGQLTLSVKPTGSVSGTIAYKNASNASASTSVTNLSYVTININPSTHLYEPQGDGSYKITLTLTNVQVSTQKMSDTKEVIRHSHPDVVADKLENVRIVDFNTNPPKHYGSILFGEDESGTLTAHGHSYSLIDHLKYWVTNSGWNHFYHKGVIGDWFAILLDYGNVLPSIKWFLNGDSNYNAAYSFSGLHRSFFPWGAFENREGIFASFDITNAKSTALIFGGYTLPLNYMLCNSGYQTPATAATAVDQDNAVAKVTDDACSKLKSSDNTRVYVIKYRIADSNLGNSSKAALEKCAYGASSPYTQTVSTEADLIAALQEIADDIKTFADRKDYHVDE
ncbi:MAG: hypothetical protein LBT63_00630, partial [Holosporaceae bacterium]|nr:hypothetical protein [Holosporaceae bacterium]